MITRISFDYGWTPMQIHHPHWSLTEYSVFHCPWQIQLVVIVASRLDHH